MIGFVEVEIEKIRKAYNFIKNDIENKAEIKVGRKADDLSRLLVSKKKCRLFSRREQLKVKNLLHELVYSSLVTESTKMLLRIEVASLIQDILILHEADSVKSK